MDRAALDAFFAEAEDVLTDWHGSIDAMHAKAPESEDAEALSGDSYYSQYALRHAQCWSQVLALLDPSSDAGWQEVGLVSDESLVRALAGPPIRNDIARRLWLNSWTGSTTHLEVQPAPQVAVQWGDPAPRDGSPVVLTILDEVRDWPGYGFIVERAPTPAQPQEGPMHGPVTLQQHALEQRRNRNTGPTDRRRLDRR